MRRAGIDDVLAQRTTSDKQNELAKLRRRLRVLEQGIEILRRPKACFAKDAALK